VKKIALLAFLTIAAAVGVAQPAYAPPPPKRPQASTGDATAIGQTAATLQGSVNPRGAATTYRFDYGKTSGYGSSTTPQSAGSGTSDSSVSARITGLAPGMTYHFRVEATNSAGTTLGKDRRFTTLPRLTIAAKPALLVFGSTTTISGQLQSESNAGETVELEADPYPYGGFATVATTTTDSLGRYTFAGRRPGLNTRFRTRTVKAPLATSPVATVGVRIRLTRQVSDATPAAGQSVTFSGFACPAHVGGLLFLQRRTSTGAWVTVAQTHLVQTTASPTCGNRSRYQLAIRVNHNRTFRAVAAGDADHLKGISPKIAIVVH
jgi:hypothetical protein